MLALDPYKQEGVLLKKTKADLITLGDENLTGKTDLVDLEKEARTFDWPGEFEMSGVNFEAFSAKDYPTEAGVKGENALVFVYVVDGFKIAHLSALSHEVSDKLIDKIGDVDVLMIPVGGGDLLEDKTAQILIESIEPRIVIPMGSQDASGLLKLMNKTELTPEPKLTLKKRADLPVDNMNVMLLEPQG